MLFKINNYFDAMGFAIFDESRIIMVGGDAIACSYHYNFCYYRVSVQNISASKLANSLWYCNTSLSVNF